MAKNRILVVDDEPNAVRVCVAMLQIVGFEAHGTTNSTEAIQLYKNERFDLALVDLKMPEMDGLEVLAALREYDPKAAVVILTAYGTKENVVEALRLGAREFLEKPLDSDVLVSTVRNVLAQGGKNTVHGNLRILTLSSIVQINCTERNQAHLLLRRQGQEGSLFFSDGDIVHATLGAKTGEEAIYDLLTWEDGDFELEMGVLPPERTIVQGWSGLLLEGMRRIDERAAEWDGLDILTESQEQIETEFQQTESQETETQQQEVEQMATRRRSDILNEHLENLLASSADIRGAVVVGHDGLVLASNVPMAGHDATRIGAEGAALFGLSQRTLQGLKCGNFQVAVLEGTEGWVISAGAGPEAMVMGLTAPKVNLGMALLEMRDIAKDVAETMA
jgi:DNA-binding response OmpR family regulator/predicted regulator of Ras-like GTPase activity (Roadblock/LC7/MglB family)